MAMTQISMDWTKAETHLKSIASELMKNSLTVQRYCREVLPLKNRFNDGERSPQLFDAIMRLT